MFPSLFLSLRFISSLFLYVDGSGLGMNLNLKLSEVSSSDLVPVPILSGLFVCLAFVLCSSVGGCFLFFFFFLFLSSFFRCQRRGQDGIQTGNFRKVSGPDLVPIPVLPTLWFCPIPPPVPFWFSSQLRLRRRFQARETSKEVSPGDFFFGIGSGW